MAAKYVFVAIDDTRSRATHANADARTTAELSRRSGRTHHDDGEQPLPLAPGGVAPAPAPPALSAPAAVPAPLGRCVVESVVGATGTGRKTGGGFLLFKVVLPVVLPTPQAGQRRGGRGSRPLRRELHPSRPVLLDRHAPSIPGFQCGLLDVLRQPLHSPSARRRSQSSLGTKNKKFPPKNLNFFPLQNRFFSFSSFFLLSRDESPALPFYRHRRRFK